MSTVPSMPENAPEGRRSGRPACVGAVPGRATGRQVGEGVPGAGRLIGPVPVIREPMSSAIHPQSRCPQVDQFRTVRRPEECPVLHKCTPGLPPGCSFGSSVRSGGSDGVRLGRDSATMRSLR